MRATQLLVFAGLVLAFSFAGCMGKTKTVSATDSQFTPNSLSISQNDKVKWTNDGTMRHNVGIHKVGEPATTTKKDTDIEKGTSTDYKFEETGTFHVFCKYHSSGAAGTYNTGMVMTVTVD